MRARVILYNSENDAMLLIHRLKNGRDYWVIPGDGAEGNETPVETALREIKEELNIQLKPADLTHLLEWVASADLTQINLMPPEIAAKIVTLI